MNASTKKRIGIFGGTFDPPHRGHLQVADAAVDQLRLDRMFLVPARVSPFKEHRKCAPIRHRLNMVRLLLQNNPAFRLSLFEVRRPQTSFTIDTVRYFRKRFPHAELFLIIGEDNYRTFSHWHAPMEIMRLCQLCVYRRAGKPVRPDKRARVTFLKGGMVQVSSTQIRRILRTGGALDHWVPMEIEQYIVTNSLYRNGRESK